MRRSACGVMPSGIGVIVLAFQEGLLSGLFADTGPTAIEVTSLAFLFALTFALATDYAVLVMARIKEQHDRRASNEEAVAVGISRTGRVITAAAARAGADGTLRRVELVGARTAAPLAGALAVHRLTDGSRPPYGVSRTGR